MRMTLEDKYKFKELDNRIRNGEFEAMFEYAWLYQDKFSELITSAIADKMVEYYTACVEAGNMTAALNLGAMYYGGEHIPQDYKKAIGLYEMATQSDDYGTKVRAWCNLGYCYYYGRDIPVDDEKAFNCYMHAVLLRDANALYKIGDMYRYGRYVSKDENMAMEFYRQAWNEVQDGTPPYADICKRIGECALYGIGMEKDALLAVRMLARAESSTYEKISERDPFAYSLLPKIQKMLGEAKALVEKTLEI